MAECVWATGNPDEECDMLAGANKKLANEVRVARDILTQCRAYLKLINTAFDYGGNVVENQHAFRTLTKQVDAELVQDLLVRIDDYLP